MIDEHSAWNPGLESDIPPAYRKLETIYDLENVTTRFEDVSEISTQTGMNPQELVVFKPERLVLHELIVRVTADILVLEGEDESELGRSFRRITKHILTHYIQPGRGEITRVYDELHVCACSRVRQELVKTLFTTSAPEPARKGFSLFSRRKEKKAPPMQGNTIFERERRAISTFREKGLVAEDPLSNAIYKSLYLSLIHI